MEQELGEEQQRFEKGSCMFTLRHLVGKRLEMQGNVAVGLVSIGFQIIW